ncbi:MAG TPA: hypothetical protein VKN63_12085, partial [Afifellaceae bacterium]|nr:hypothetical protein [Afifellaceae bacterium]
MDPLEPDDEFGPWNPGLESQIPRQYLPLSTMFRPENVSTSIDEANELSDFCGLKPYEVVAFRAERLIVHELLIRVTADLSVPDGPNYEELGINLRGMAACILEAHIAPEMAALTESHEALRRQAMDFLTAELADHFSPSAPAAKQKPAKPSLFNRLFSGGEKKQKPSASAGRRPDADPVPGWRKSTASADDPFRRACLEALAKVAGAISGHRGRLLGDPQTIAGLAANLVGNGYGSKLLGEAISPLIGRAAEAENYRFLQAQEKPVVMNVKGASAAGKSTIRPQQRQLAGQLGIPWDDFALISPDYWRKFLLDYDSLGEAYKYAAMLTGHELEIIDKKLDRYMADKAARGAMSHLLIDRFRFDSFTVADGRDVDSPLLTRFGDLIFMFFMITPPDATVERAWSRGLKTGRYKAVDDLLYHNIEAYTGIPHLFFSWASVNQKRVHYEFLDNSVAEGELPRTVAFGWNGTMTILDIKYLLDIERYRKINIDAQRPEDVYDSEQMAPELNTAFLEQCAGRIPTIN